MIVRISDVIRYLRACNTANTWRIEGAAKLFEAQDDSRLLQPSFYVGLGNFGTTNLSDIRAGFRQQYDMRIVVIFGCATTFEDRTGKFAQDLVSDARTFLWRNMLNKRLCYYAPNGVLTEILSAYPVTYVGDSMMDMDRARYWHKFEFSQGGEIQLEDTYQPDLGPFSSLDVVYNLEEVNPLTHPNAEDFIVFPT